MDIRPLTPDYAVSPQIAPEDLPAIAEAGFTAVICNRPDAENPPDWQAAAMQDAAEAAGLRFHVLPITHDSMTPERIAQQKALVAENDGPVLAYCASGTRCTVIWALGEAGTRGADEILQIAGRAGYALEPLRPRLEQG
ncbi:TIGR01244 family sulfur transferase [Poseidonocella sedimentorum]|uniref:TIGR01244 family protein n=1 Tax=Poseidonocella sedimentorum TaxID=871652 RepID=A0A1I6CX80_9RHOB|nr:TIGR01244 family sulfur transferase [Poseidonocella sedimentorum]SFQ97663.1 TIGR01244 family protein [Poseidonocella sedimentorum]